MNSLSARNYLRPTTCVTIYNKHSKSCKCFPN